jgi:hypothetical protein
MTTLTWTGSGNDGNWNNAANWSGGAPGAVPGSGDTIVVNSTVVLTTGPNLNHGTLTVQTTNPGSSIRFVNSNFNNSTVVVTGPVSGGTRRGGGNPSGCLIWQGLARLTLPQVLDHSPSGFGWKGTFVWQGGWDLDDDRCQQRRY